MIWRRGPTKAGRPEHPRHSRLYLSLLPSGPDEVRKRLLRGVRPQWPEWIIGQGTGPPSDSKRADAPPKRPLGEPAHGGSNSIHHGKNYRI